MSTRASAMAVAAAIALIVVVAFLVLSRDAISKRMFMRSGRQLEEKLDPTLRKKYGGDLQYTLQTFWKFYERGLLSRNDVNDVSDKMKILRTRPTIEDREIFDFIGYVSRLYTEAMKRSQSEMFPE
jgi:hypothetical protein